MKLNDSSDSITVAVGLFVIFGGLLGIAMGCALSLIHFYRVVVGSTTRRLLAFEIVMISYFLLSLLTMVTAMPYSSIYIASIFFSCAVFLYFTIRYAKVTLGKQPPKTKQPGSKEL